jgi:hypothetical protein
MYGQRDGAADWNVQSAAGCPRPALFKTIALNERSGFPFRAEAYDSSNHPHLSGPNYNPNSSQFGEIASKTGLQRTLQLSLPFYF